MTSTSPSVDAHRVVVHRDGRAVVDHVDLTIGTGEWVTIAGPNGAGKTTLLRAIAGLIDSTGRIDVGGRPLRSLRPAARARIVAYVPQKPVMPPGTTVAAYVMLGRTAHLRPLHRESAHDRDVVADVLDQFELAPFAGRHVTTLSGGEQQRAALARGLAQQTEVLLLDEPTAALDLGHQQDLLDHIDRVRHERNVTVVSTMHDLTLAAQYADRLVLLRHGRVAVSGPPAGVLVDAQVAAAYGARVHVIVHQGHHVVIPIR